MKHWVFDLDGTLVDSLTIHFEILAEVFDRFGVAFGANEHQEVLRETAKTFPSYLTSRLEGEKGKQALELFTQKNSSAYRLIKPFAGVEDVLDTLTSKGFKLAVWTARESESTARILESTGLKKHFPVCVTGSCVEQGKPHPEGLEKIASHFDCENDSMVMVGDFDSDMLGAQAFGSKAVRVLWHSAVPQKRCEIANWQFHKVQDFRIWIENL